MKRRRWLVRRTGRTGGLVLALVLAGGSFTRAAADEVNMCAASSLSDVLKDVAQSFAAKTGHKILFNVGASNDLARQIKAGAPADIFFSADDAQMDGLQKEGLVRSEDRVSLLSNVLVIVVPPSSGATIREPKDLPTVKHLALADPEAVPAGIYARTWLQSIGLWDLVKDRVVPTLNVRAALSAVETESVEAGIVYRTDAALSRRAKIAYEVPREQGPRIVYPMAPLAASQKAATGELVRYLTSPAARESYTRFGFIVLLK